MMSEEKKGNTDTTLAELLRRVCEFFYECTKEEKFCGLSIDEMRDGEGKIQGLQLVACDVVGFEPKRRINRFESSQILPGH